MPYSDPDPSDPNILVGVPLPATAETTENMAYVFAEEFARMGFDKEKIMRIFNQPFYTGAHRACVELGKEKIERIVNECLAIWGDDKLEDRNAAMKTSKHGAANP